MSYTKVRNQFSWIPKELVARFVRQCPTCISRRNGSQSLSAYTSKTSSPRVDYTPSASGSYCYDAATMAAAAAAAAVNVSTPSLLYTPSSKAESDMSTSPSTDNTYKRSPNSYINTSSSPTKRPFFGQNGLFESGDYDNSHRQMKLSTDGGQKTGPNYQIQTSPNSNNLPFSYRRQEYMHYSTYSEHPPSYYNALMNSYNNNDNANLINQHNNSSAFIPMKLEQHQEGSSPNAIKVPNANNRSSILSHHNSEPQL